MNKDEIRRRVKASKSLLSASDKSKAAAAVFSRLEQSEIFAAARNILIYHSLPDELSTHSFLEKWSGQKQLFLPRVKGADLEILPYDSSRMATGSFHIEEPQGDDTTDISRIELIVVPAVAYDRHGNRVGRGKGYYDRLLAKTQALKIGVGYDFQLLDEEIPAEPHDVAVDMVITENRHIVTHHRKQQK